MLVPILQLDLQGQAQPAGGMDLALLLLNDPVKFQASFAVTASKGEQFRLNLKGRTTKETRKRGRVLARAVQEYHFE